MVSLFSAASLLAGVTGSPHDFSKSSLITKYSTAPIAPAGPCSICHIPHNAQYGALWPRDLLSTYDNALGMNGGTGGTDKPNYKRPVTVQCYDCHDAHVTTDKINDVPAFNAFETNHKPQNIAFGFTKGGSTDSGSTMKEDGPAGTVPGYYENNPPYATSPTTYYGADSSTGSPFKRPLDNATLARSGGHYFKTQDPSPTVYKGDKIGCSECHDPHAWDSANRNWQAFFRPSKLYGNLSRWSIFSGSNPRASTFMANPVLSGGQTRSDADSRKMCILCHGDSNSTLPVTFNDISSDYSSTSPIISPPATVGEHASGSQIACVSCHAHNAIGANCTQCHGFPPSSTASPAYPLAPYRFVPAPLPAIEDSHVRHYGGSSGQPRNGVYRFDCGICHFGSALGVNPTLQQHQNAHVSVMIQGAWTAAPNLSDPTFGPYDNTNYYNPSFPAGPTGELDNSQYSGGWGGTANRPLGDTYGWNQCRNVYCHSIGRKISSMPVGDNNYYRQDVKWNSGPQHCNDCHGRSVADNTNPAWGMPDYAGGPAGSDTANSHGAHVVRAGYECSVCHSATVTGTGANRAILSSFPTKHVNGIRDVSFDGTNASGTYDNSVNSKTCVVSCHGNNPVRWGGPPQNCDSCHARVGDVDDFGTGTQASMSRNGITAGIDNNEWNWSGHGKDTGNYDVSGNPPANLLAGATGGANKCAYCHNPAISHDNATNPFRLANFDVFSQGWNGTCYVCHAGAAVGNSAPGYAPAADNAGGYAARTATRKVANNHYNPGNTTNARHSTTYNGGKFCYDCHDPHGDRNSSGAGNIFMIGKRVSMATDNVYGIPVGGNDNSHRPAPVFTNNGAGSNYADNTTFLGVCQVCHTAGVVSHWTSTTGDGHNAATKCVTCHTHDGGFRGLGGPDVGQYFDRSILAPGPQNFFDNSSHPLMGLTTADNTLRFGAQGSPNCLGCHYSSGPARTSDECLMCHFESAGGGSASLGSQHMDKTIQLAAVSGNSLPTAQYAISTLTDYDNWCLQCHQTTTISLGGIFPSAARRTVIDPSAFASGRHRAQSPPVGCIYCHAPHGSGNARLVRINPANRGSAGATPLEFGVFPGDNSGLYTGSFGATGSETRPYRARVDNVSPNVFADADDENAFCNKACHAAKILPAQSKDKAIRRDGTTGNYSLAPGNKKVYQINGAEYTIDNVTSLQYSHGHINDEIISTDNMVKDYAALIGLTGPSYYHYPNLGGALPGAYTVTQNASSPLPFFPDFGDGTRDFTNAWNNLFATIKYRFTCSTCHNPHGTTDTSGNLPNGNSYPDLREKRTNPPALCRECHK